MTPPPPDSSQTPTPPAAAPLAPHTRKPGEAVFAVLMVAFSAILLWNAYGISGFESLSAPGSVPMAATFVMGVAAVLSLVKTLRMRPALRARFHVEVVPPVIALMGAILLAYAFALKPLGFLPTSALFLIVSIKLLARRSWIFTLCAALGSLICIYLVFRIVFTVLMPAGIVPEGENIQIFRSLLKGGM